MIIPRKYQMAKFDLLTICQYQAALLWLDSLDLVSEFCLNSLLAFIHVYAYFILSENG